MRILGITGDWGSGFLRTVRLEMPLSNLARQGLIEDFAVTDGHLRHVDPERRFDAIWLQRVDDHRLISALRATVGGRYLYDIDDYLLGNADYLAQPLTQRRSAVLGALDNCARVAMPTHRLRALLETALGRGLGDKTVICPNGSEFAHGLKPNEPPSGVAWVSSVNPALTRSRTAVVEAVARFVRDRRLPMWFVGAAPPELVSAFDGAKSVGAMSYWQYVTWLGSRAPMIGIAPLETDADADTLAVIQGKSDVKMAEYAGFGHLGVYSDAPPYRESDLGVGRLAQNTRESWEAALEESAATRWQSRSDEQERVVALRRMDRLAAESWLPALEAVRLDAPLRAKDILPHARRGVVMRDLVASLNAHSPIYRSLRGIARGLGR